jgi:hypothetical protein
MPDELVTRHAELLASRVAPALQSSEEVSADQ